MTGDLPFPPDDFDPYAGFTGGLDEPDTGPLHPPPDLFHPADLFDASGLALQFGPPPAAGPDDLGDHGPHLSWYDAPHPW